MSNDVFERMVDATVTGDREACVALAEDALVQGIPPTDIIQKGFTKGMVIVGGKFERMEYFLPDLMRSADAVNAAMEVLKPHMLEEQDEDGAGTVVLGTIQGDLHDVGKNIVRIMLQASGFKVYDEGTDVSVRRFVERAEEVDADIIAASAILTTTMAYMPDLVDLLTDMGVRDKYLVMVGGGPVNEDWALKIGADGYGENATQAVSVAKALMQEKRGEA